MTEFRIERPVIHVPETLVPPSPAFTTFGQTRYYVDDIEVTADEYRTRFQATTACTCVKGEPPGSCPHCTERP